MSCLALHVPCLALHVAEVGKEGQLPLLGVSLSCTGGGAPVSLRTTRAGEEGQGEELSKALELRSHSTKPGVVPFPPAHRRGWRGGRGRGNPSRAEQSAAHHHPG